MEPLFFKAENRANLAEPFIEIRLCFNGAAFFQSGKCASLSSLVVPSGRASMEPLFFKAENAACRLPPGQPQSRFNGAAFFQSGK